MYSVIFDILRLNYLLGPTGPLVADSRIKGERQLTINKNEVCYDVYGDQVCFNLGSPWQRGTNENLARAPMSVEELNTIFSLYTRKGGSTPEILDLNDIFSIANAAQATNRSVKIITHGYISSTNNSFIKPMRQEFLRASDCHAVEVNWSSASTPPYLQAMANLRMVAVQVAKLIYVLHTYADIPMSNFHLIGHSLGAHMMGITGEYLRDIYGLTVGRVTGLDPAGIYYDHDVDKRIRLDTTDASFVDVIHSDNADFLGFPVGLGIREPIGHLNFYPNGGGAQPECNGEMKCEHERAGTLFVESIRQSCQFIGVECDSYQNFLQGKCWGCQNKICSVMGPTAILPSSNPENKKLFLRTNGKTPFCGTHYRVSITIKNNTEAVAHGGEFALVKLILKGRRHKTAPLWLTDKSFFYSAGGVHRFVILASDVGDLEATEVTFGFQTSIWNPMSWRLLDLVHHVQFIVVETLDKRWKYCTNGITPNRIYTFNKENIC